MNFKKKVNGSWTDIPHYIHNTSTDTITTLPADLYADGNNATVGLVGNMSQTGTPTPSNPIYPQECGDKTANLFDYTASTIGKYVRDNNGTLGNDENTSATGYIDVSGIETIYPWYFTDSNPTKKWAAFYNNNKEYVSGFSGYNQAVTVPNNAAYVRLTVDNSYINVFSVSDKRLSAYEPYGQYKIPISCGGTTTPVYLGEVQSTRNIKKLVLTGQESWQITSNNKWLYFELADVPTRRISPISSHYTGSSTVSYANLADNSVTVSIYDNNQYRLALYDSRFTTVADFKTYLQQQYTNETPVTLWYVLGTPTTSTLNEPIRKIGDYADTVSGITIPTIAGADSFDVLTTLKPSEVTASFNGWHPVSSVHERSGGSWT